MNDKDTQNEKKKIIIYTDGACSGNPGAGGWGAIFLYKKQDANGEKEYKKIISGGEELTTNNKMELSAVLNALSVLKEPCEIELFTDSKYVLEGASKWLKDWIAKGWRTSNKKPVANQDLWQQLIPLLEKHEIHWHWVKGHDTDKLNNEVDKIARGEAIKSQNSNK